MERIANEQRFRSISLKRLGVVFNDFTRRGASGAQYNVVHAASCRWLARSNLSVAKFWFEDLATAIDWLVRDRGVEGQAWKRCATCQARGPRPRPPGPPVVRFPSEPTSPAARSRLSDCVRRRWLPG